MTAIYLVSRILYLPSLLGMYLFDKPKFTTIPNASLSYVIKDPQSPHFPTGNKNRLPYNIVNIS